MSSEGTLDLNSMPFDEDTSGIRGELLRFQEMTPFLELLRYSPLPRRQRSKAECKATKATEVRLEEKAMEG